MGKGPLSNAEDLVALSGQLARREISPVELIMSTLERIARLNPILNAYITVLEEAAYRAASVAEQEIAAGGYRGPLHGVPISVKDLYWTSGTRTTAGSRILAEFVPEQDATVVRRLEAAGAILVAKANMMEFAYAGVHPDYGRSKNPWGLARTTSGSSGGSAAAVAARMDFGSFGTDTSGSIRIPASFCGVTGLKPTFGRVSRFGVIPLSWTMDHPGPIGRSVRDVAVLAQAVAGFDPLDPTSTTIEVPPWSDRLGDRLDHISIGVLTNFMTDGVAQEVRDAVERAVAVLEQAGAVVQELAVPEIEELAMSARANILQPEASYVHREWLGSREKDYSDFVRARLRAGASVPAIAYFAAKDARETLRKKVVEIQQRVDLFVLPTTPTVAPLEETGPRGVRRRMQELHELVRRTAPFNITAQPALSLPCGFSDDGLPIGLQIVGREFDEATVLQAGHAFQLRTDWHLRRPPIVAGRGVK